VTISVTRFRRRPGRERFGPSGGSIWLRAISDDPETETTADARAALETEAPAEIDGFFLRGVDVDLIAQTDHQSVWFGEARYGAGTGFAALPVEDLNHFTAALASERMNRSHAVVDSGGSGGGPAPDHGGLVLVNRDGQPEGTDALRPVFTAGYTTSMPAADVEGTYLTRWLLAFGTVNGESFKQFPAGTLLFQGLSVEKRPTRRYDVRLEFGFRRNESNVQIGDGMSADVEGWDFLEIQPELGVDADVVFAKPSYYYVHRIYERTVFGDLGV